MKKTYLFIFPLLVLSACNKDKYFKGLSAYSDGFENYFTSKQLTEIQDKYWSFTQLTRDGNAIDIDSFMAHSGKKCLRFSAKKSTPDAVSKCSVSKQNMAFKEGEIFHFSAWYYIAGNEPADWLFLFDLEEKVAVGAGPGMRLALVGDSGQLRVEHKYFNKDILQKNPIQFPLNQWVHIEFETLLSQKKKGYVKVWQNGQLIIEQYKWKTLPTDFLYNQQGTKGIYNSVEIGITANTRNSDMVLLVDDVEATKK